VLANCVSFLDPFVYYGGGEMITRRLLQVGRARGHDIRITSVRPTRKAFHSKPDVTLAMDVFNHGHTFLSLGAWRSFATSFLHSVIGSKPLVHITTAYADVCNLPSLPCSGIDPTPCPFKPLPLLSRALLRDFGSDCFACTPAVRSLYEAAMLNVFLSPLHKETTERVLGRTLESTFILKPVVNAALFRNEHRERDIDYLFVGLIGEAKGLNAMRVRFKNCDIRLIGRIAPGTKLDFGQYVGFLPYEEVPLWMNRARNFVFLPRWPEPQGRVVVEAALCGCRIIANDNVGALSFNFDLSDPTQYADAEESFWRAVEGIGGHRN
jgi:glycosyltransferase involved in cell wall biosynthesis